MLSLIACCDKTLAIGYQNKLLYHLPADMKHFKEKTEGKICIQGRLTYESIIGMTGKPLQNRRNIILTRDQNFKPDYSSFVYHSIEEVLKLIQGQVNTDEEVMVIGGSMIYKAFLPYADKVYLTIVDSESNEADSYFPMLDDHWKLTNKQHNKADEKNKYNYSFITFENNHRQS
ncbi:dihydrofolate reductase [Bacillus subtilis]|uniref:dihydrofolate reductase n=1 Tax=Bacillus subtilis TaxID=1423 RepID=UPI000DF85EF4|nr:dihydrofolate reductase [Bacillus subtilis]MBG8575280.1 dihydrofolate reductase [Bacillus subtilis]MBG9627800.1 dihydrofolate reductase [Bacillus subtilis]MBO3635150.1 dihydrofolate reductase [Bacillus subtilis]MCF7606559.1 dihydrofolate reductase [Bacillus subtilis]MCF7613038.1 dihydrofolate reductase [Bacillus subtilis]